MRRTKMGILYAAVMAAVIVTVDVLWLRHLFWERLLVNVGLALIAAALYLHFLRRS